MAEKEDPTWDNGEEEKKEEEKEYMYCKKVIDETDIQKMIDDVKKSSEK